MYTCVLGEEEVLFTHLSCIEERKERKKSDTEMHGIPPQFFYVAGEKLPYTVPMDDYEYAGYNNEQMN